MFQNTIFIAKVRDSSGRGLFKVIIQRSAWRDWESPRKGSDRFPSVQSRRRSPDCESGGLPLCYPASFLR